LNAELQALPYIITVAGAGYFSVTEYQNDLWVSNIVANKRGDGNKVFRAMMKYASDRGKTLYGAVNQMSPGMDNQRLKKWYLKMGAEIVNDNVMRM
jgi:hypothetical protein